MTKAISPPEEEMWHADLDDDNFEVVLDEMEQRHVCVCCVCWSFCVLISARGSRVCGSISGCVSISDGCILNRETGDSDTKRMPTPLHTHSDEEIVVSDRRQTENYHRPLFKNILHFLSKLDDSQLRKLKRSFREYGMPFLI